MQRNYDIKAYVDTVKDNESFFRKYYFHSIIDLNLIKLDYILKYGLLSRKNIEQRNLLSFYVHSIRSYDCKNGNDYISLVDFNSLVESKEGCAFSQLFEAFALHTLTSLSIMIDRDVTVSKKGVLESCFDDEVFVRDYVDKSHIKGIILPEHLVEESICNIPFLPGDSYCYTETQINHLIDCMEAYFNKKIFRDELLASVKQAWQIRNERCSITSAVALQKERHGIDMKDILSKLINGLWQEKLKVENPSYIDVINYINNDIQPIYEINQKTLKKLN